MEWFRTSVETSDATFKLVISPTPIVGPDRVKLFVEVHENAFVYFEANADTDNCFPERVPGKLKFMC